MSRKQCKACPWKVSTVPERDIPGGYDPQRHRNLIACQTDGGFRPGPLRMMACHEFPPGAEQACVGWVINQLGPGNNIDLRIHAMGGDFNDWETEGEQHESVQAMCNSAPMPKRRAKRKTTP